MKARAASRAFGLVPDGNIPIKERYIEMRCAAEVCVPIHPRRAVGEGARGVATRIGSSRVSCSRFVYQSTRQLDASRTPLETDLRRGVAAVTYFQRLPVI